MIDLAHQSKICNQKSEIPLRPVVVVLATGVLLIADCESFIAVSSCVRENLLKADGHIRRWALDVTIQREQFLTGDRKSL